MEVSPMKHIRGPTKQQSNPLFAKNLRNCGVNLADNANSYTTATQQPAIIET
jgi:hypothetical protein